MNKAFIATAFLVLLVLAHAETFERAKLRGITSKMSTENLFKAMKGSEFGKTLLNMLTLKFKTSDGHLEKLIELLSDLEDQIQGQQAADDQNFSQNSDVLNQGISDQEATIADATNNLNNYQGQLADNQGALAQAQQQLALLEQQVQQITDSLANDAQIRATDSANFQTRVQNEELLVAGLQKVSDLFASLTSNSEVNQESVQQIGDLLANLIAAFQSSIATDQAQENQVQADYEASVTARQATLEEVNAAIVDLQGQIAQLEATIEQLESNIASEQVRLDGAEQLLDQFQSQLKDLTDRYTSNTATRSQQVNLLATVNVRLTQNREEVQDVLNQAL